MPGQFPLFITRYSLSSRTAIGVQTKLFLEPYEQWLHFHWISNELPRQHPNSHRIESAAVSRWGIFNRNNRLARGLRRLGGGKWTNDQLHAGFLRRLVARHKDQVSVIYAAPLDNADATRMKQLIEAFHRPFVLHIWDMFDGAAKPGGSQEWLIKHAESVLCLSKPIYEEVARLRPDADYLLFLRKPAAVRASAPQGKRLRVALIGNLGSYSEGVDLLNEAIDLLSPRGFTIDVSFIGPTATLKRLKSPIFSKVQPVGFAKTDADRDRALSKCNVAFLPGPFEDPAQEMRSRYSIPSRVLDFFAVGLPVVGTVHPDSATADLFRSVDITSRVFCRTAPEIAASLEQLTDPAVWNAASSASAGAFSKLHQESQPAKLKAVFDGIPCGDPQGGA